MISLSRVFSFPDAARASFGESAQHNKSHSEGMKKGINHFGHIYTFFYSHQGRGPRFSAETDTHNAAR